MRIKPKRAGGTSPELNNDGRGGSGLDVMHVYRSKWSVGSADPEEWTEEERETRN